MYTYLRDVTIARFKEALRKTAAPKYRPWTACYVLASYLPTYNL